MNDCGSKRTGGMDLVDLRYLSITVETGSFSSAAQSLGIKPSTISRRIVRLEDELGVTVFERGPFGIRLTAAGRDLMVLVRRTLDSFDNVTRAEDRLRFVMTRQSLTCGLSDSALSTGRKPSQSFRPASPVPWCWRAADAAGLPLCVSSRLGRGAFHWRGPCP